MTIYYSQSTGSFYADLDANLLPLDVIEVTEDQHKLGTQNGNVVTV